MSPGIEIPLHHREIGQDIRKAGEGEREQRTVPGNNVEDAQRLELGPAKIGV